MRHVHYPRDFLVDELLPNRCAAHSRAVRDRPAVRRLRAKPPPALRHAILGARNGSSILTTPARWSNWSAPSRRLGRVREYTRSGRSDSVTRPGMALTVAAGVVVAFVFVAAPSRAGKEAIHVGCPPSS